MQSKTEMIKNFVSKKINKEDEINALELTLLLKMNAIFFPTIKYIYIPKRDRDIQTKTLL